MGIWQDARVEIDWLRLDGPADKYSTDSIFNFTFCFCDTVGTLSEHGYILGLFWFCPRATF